MTCTRTDPHPGHLAGGPCHGVPEPAASPPPFSLRSLQEHAARRQQPATAPAAAGPHPDSIELDDTPCDDSGCRCCYPMGVHPALTAAGPHPDTPQLCGARWVDDEDGQTVCDLPAGHGGFHEETETGFEWGPPHPGTPDGAAGAELDLDEIEARVAAATPGPWWAFSDGPESGDHWYVASGSEAVAHIHSDDGRNEDARQPDAEFIAQARDDVPALVAEVRRLRGLVSPAAGRVLDAVRQWARAWEEDPFGPAMSAAKARLAAAWDALDADQPAERGLWARESDITGHEAGVSAGQPAGPRARPELHAVAEQVAAAAGADAGHGPRLSELQAAARAAGGRLRVEVELAAFAPQRMRDALRTTDRIVANEDAIDADGCARIRRALEHARGLYGSPERGTVPGVATWTDYPAPDQVDMARRADRLTAELDQINAILSRAGIEHPTGAQGVLDLAGMAVDRADELAQMTAERNWWERQARELAVREGNAAARLADSIDPTTIPDQQARGWPDFHPEDFCHRCGRRNVSWYADSAIWNEIHGGSGPIWCPVCFATAYEQQTGQRVSWRLAPRDLPDEAAHLVASEAAMRHERDRQRRELERLKREVDTAWQAAGDMEARERHAAADALEWAGEHGIGEFAAWGVQGRQLLAWAAEVRAGTRPVPGSPQPAEGGGGDG